MKVKLSSIYITLSCTLLIIVSSCRQDSSLREDDLFYFPEKNVYYDERNEQYYYSLDGLRSWDSLAFNEADYGKTLGLKVPVRRAGSVAWANNDSDRKVHNGIILNLVNSQTLSMQRQDSLKRIRPVVTSKPKPVGVQEVAEEEPPKKGLKKFFNKIFGKKKPKKE